MSKIPRFNNFGEYLYYSYANLQMAVFALNCEKTLYDTDCYKVRAKAFKAYKDGKWEIHDLMQNNVAKMKSNNFCWYCGEEFEDASTLTIDHIFPRSKGGGNEIDNIFLVCKHCNSSKRNMDLFEWFMTVREEFPPIHILAHYLKNIYFYALEHNLLDKHRKEMDNMNLPFNYRYIPLEYPEPKDLI